MVFELFLSTCLVSPVTFVFYLLLALRIAPRKGWGTPRFVTGIGNPRSCSQVPPILLISLRTLLLGLEVC